ncbi:Homeobox protein meis3 [Varanus komodoensis]|nr:Homeobox protein meis3 [Varanus komodoensis]
MLLIDISSDDDMIPPGSEAVCFSVLVIAALGDCSSMGIWLAAVETVSWIRTQNTNKTSFCPKHQFGSGLGSDIYLKTECITLNFGKTILKQWHMDKGLDDVELRAHPYPSEEQKKQLAQDTGLTILQVNNW